MTVNDNNRNARIAFIAAFTLIELSIVLLIIGLVVGGTLVGRDLIKAAQARATLTQIEKYDQAANTFYGKFGYLPGDIGAVAAAQFGLTPRGSLAGQGDGNGIIEGYASDVGNCGYRQAEGETVMFWVDLTSANGMNINLVEGFFNAASPTTAISSGGIAGTALNNYFPQAKLGQGNYIYVWSGGVINGTCSGGTSGGGNNYFGISVITSVVGTGTPGAMLSSPGLSVAQAYAIDTKIDDGLPQSGRVIAAYVANNDSKWAGTSDTSATQGNSTTCYDNGGNSGTQLYSLSQSGGAGINCGLSIRLQ